jgi:hypothetical protein
MHSKRIEHDQESGQSGSKSRIYTPFPVDFFMFYFYLAVELFCHPFILDLGGASHLTFLLPERAVLTSPFS